MIKGRTDAAVDARIHVALPNLSPSDRRVAETVLEAGPLLVTWSISDLARAAGTSASTVSRACRSLGFDSYQALKLAAAKDAAVGEQLRESDEPTSIAISDANGVLRRIAELHIRSIRSISATINGTDFERSVATLRRARRIVLIGVGTSAAPALDAAHRLMTIGLDADAPSETNRRIAVSRLNEHDAVVALSYSGSSKETIRAAEQARALDVPVIGVTCFAGSPLTTVATINLVVGGPELSFRLEALSSRIAHLTVLDAIYVAIAMQDADRASRALDATAKAIADQFL